MADLLPDDRLPNFLIIGALRSGTTSLALYLGAHPDVYIARQKEVRFFDVNFDKGLQWYARQFRGATGEHAVGEASPGYLYHEVALQRLSGVLPDVRLVAILREPVDRAYSHYWMNRALGIETLSFSDAIAMEPERLATTEWLGRGAFAYLDTGRYLPQLHRVCERYPRDALLVTLFEDLRDSPRETYRSVCRFLGVDDTFAPPLLGSPVNRFVTFRSLLLRRLSKRLPRAAARVVGRLNVRRGLNYPPLDPRERERLRERFETDNAALASWLGHDLTAWNGRAA